MSKKQHTVDYSEKVLEVKNLRQYFSSGVGKRKVHVKAVDGISFDVYKREVFGLVGESGCGKTTTGRSILRLYKPTDGKIIYKGNIIGAGYDSFIYDIKQMRRKTKREILEHQPYKLAKHLLKEQHSFNLLDLKDQKEELLKVYKEEKLEASKPKTEHEAKLKKIKEEHKFAKLELIYQFNRTESAINAEGIIPILQERDDYLKVIKNRLKDKEAFIKDLKIEQYEKDEDLRKLHEESDQDIVDINNRFGAKLLEFDIDVTDLDIKKIIRERKKAEKLDKKQRIKEEKARVKEEINQLNIQHQLKVEEHESHIYDQEKIANELAAINARYQEKLEKHKEKYNAEVAIYREKLQKLNEDFKNNPQKYQDNEEEIAKLIAERDAYVAEQRVNIYTAKMQNKLKEFTEDKEIRLEKIKNLKAEYKENLVELKEKYSLDKKAYKKSVKELKLSYKERLAEIQKTKPSFENYVSSIQTIFQDPISSLNPRMVVSEIISEGLVIRGQKNKAKNREEVYRVLKLVGLDKGHATRYPHEFSGGQRQRIGIARAIIVNPDFIIADEPISALDVSIQAQVINLLNDLKEELDLTILFIAHDLSVVKYFSDRIAVMYMGKIVELTTSGELFKNPLHPYTKSLLSAIPHPNPDLEKERQRFMYDPRIHDYSVDKPKMREIKKGHFIYANDKEFEMYKKELS